MKPTLMILAAGMGSRYGGLKQLDGIGPNGETIIDYSVYDAIRAGFGKVVFIIRKNFENDFREKITNRFENQIEVQFAYQEVDTPVEGVMLLPERKKPWGTGHAVLVAEHLIKEPFAVINADDYYGSHSFQQISNFLQNSAASDHYAMVGFTLENTLSDHGSVSRGVCQINGNSLLKSVVERTNIRKVQDVIFFEDHERNVFLDKQAVVSMNFWGFHPSIFQHLKKMFASFVENNYHNAKAEFYIPLVVNNLLKSNEAKLKVLTSSDQWYGVTYQADRPIVENAFEKLSSNGKYANPLWS